MHIKELTQTQDRQSADYEDLFCHVWYDDEPYSICGAVENEGNFECGEYNGEAICTHCGRPTCVRCARIDRLRDATGF